MLFGWVDDLGRYPEWLEHRAAGGAGRARTTIRGRRGPSTCGAGSARSPGRSGCAWCGPCTSDPDHARFERRELDGRDHSSWVLDAEVAADGDGSRLTMQLHYGGGLWVPVLERLLRDEIERSRPRLIDLIS